MMDFTGREPTDAGSETFEDGSTVNLQSQPAGNPQPAGAGARVLNPGPDNVVVLPSEAALEGIAVDGRDILVTLEDGSVIRIPDGAILVPQFVVDGVTIPPQNIAALLIGNEPQPAAGSPQSSGGNFAGDVGDIQAAYALGDLLPYTELAFPEYKEEEIIPNLANRPPEIIVITPDNPAGAIAAIGRVDEEGLPARTVDGVDETAGTAPDTDAEITSGTIVFSAIDGVSAVLINGVEVSEVGQEFVSPFGTLRITSIDLAGGEIGFIYTLADNLVGETVDGFFTMTVVDTDGDRASATLQIEVIDDQPIARDDSGAQETEDAPVTVNVFGNDVEGADGVAISTIELVDGTLSGTGTLTNNGDGTFTYVPGPGEEGEVTFDYTITDNDGSDARATVTITLLPDSVPLGGTAVASVDDDGLVGGNPSSTAGDLDANTGDDASDTSEATFTGTLTFDPGSDAPASIGFDPTLDGATATVGTETVTFSLSGSILTATGPRGVLFTVELLDAETGDYQVTLVDNVLHAGGPNDEGTDAFVSIDFIVTDTDGDSAVSSLGITFDDDAPSAFDNSASVTEGLTVEGNVLTDAADDIGGADGLAGLVALTSTNMDTSTVAIVDGNLVITGQYGTLTVDAATGAYTYVSNANSTNADAADVFTYTIVDGDGDTATATLTIDVENVAGTVSDNDATVNEAGLPAGSDAGSDSETAGGQITVTGVTGPLVYVLTSPTDGDFGTLVLDPDTGSYTYTLDTPFTDGNTAENTTNTVNGAESFDYEVYDTAGNLIGSGSVVVSIIDDVPDAVSETALSIAEDASAPAALSGNVMDNDVEGADGATVTSVTIGGTDYAVAATGTTSVGTANGAYTFDAAGNWTFDPATGLDQTNGPIDASFTYTLTDGDDDFDIATQPITITDGADPLAGPPVSLSVDDENLANGSDPSTPVTDSANIVFTPGSDAIASIVFDDSATALDALGGGLTWERVSDTQIVGRDGADTIVVLDLSVTGTTATVTLTLTDNYALHPDLGDDLAQLGSVLVVATDIDGDAVSAAVSLNVSDDLPTLDAVAAGAGTLEVDETDLGTDASADFSALFTPDYNADGPGSVSHYVLGIAAGSTGLVDTLSNEAVVLTLEAGAVVGRTATGGDIVFVVTVDASGTVTLDQQRAVVHADSTDHDDATTLLTGDIITLSATVTDADGDTATATAAIGGALSFRDDGPSIDAAVIDGDQIVLITQDVDTIGAASDTDVTAINFGNAFSVASSSYGSDGAGSIDWDFAFVIDNPNSGLFSDGVPVTLAFDGADIVGSAGGTDVFRLSVDADTGVVALTQYEEIDHALPGDTSAPYDLQLAILGDGILSLQGTASIVDGDGDEASETVTLDLGGNIRFADDGPSVTVTGLAPGLLVDETTFGTDDSADYSDVFTFDFGADGAAAGGGQGYALGIGAGSTGLVDTLSNEAVVLTLEGGQVVGRTQTGGDIVFIVSVAADGTVTLDQQRAVVHADPTLDNEPTGLASDDLITLTATATDGDGDTSSATISIGSDLTFLDDAPSTSGNLEVQLDDDTQAGGIPDGTGDVDPDTANTAGTLGHDFGNDGGTIAFLTSGAPSSDFRYVQNGAGVLVQQFQDGAWVTVVTVTLDAATGAYAVTQNANVLHAPGGDENDLSFTLTYRVTDGDNDTADGMLVVNVNDDTPIAVAGTSADSVDEDALVPGGIEGGLGDIDGGAGTVDATASGSVTALFSSGADAPLTYGFDTVAAQAYLTGLGLESGGVALTYVVTGTTIEASAGATPVFTMSLTTAGAWTFVLTGPLDHPINSTEDDILVDFGPLVQATDADGDTVTATGSVVVTVDDDTPLAVDDTNSMSENAASVGGNILTDGVDDGFGADGPGDPAINAIAGFGGAGTVGGTTDGEFGVLTLNDDGTYTYALTPGILQDLAEGESETDTFTYTIIDADGDEDTATLVITITGANDAPVVTGSVAVVSEEGLAIGNPDADGDPTDTTNDFEDSGQITIVDPDDDTFTVTLGLPTTPGLTSGGLPISWELSPDGHVLTGSTTAGSVIVVTIDDTGAWTIDLVGAIDHPDGTVEDIFTFAIPVNVSDGTTTTTVANGITVTVEDDSPVAAPGNSSGSVDEDALVPDGIEGGPGDIDGGAGTVGTIATGSVTALFSGGADTAITFGFDTTGAQAYLAGLSLESGGVPLSYVVNGNSVSATANGAPVFTMTLASNGAWQFQLFAPLDHSGVDTEDEITIDFGLLVQAIDADGDTVTATGSVLITVDDDTPLADPDTNTIDEDAVSVGGNVVADDAFGADGAGDPAVTAVSGFGGAGTVDGTTDGEFGVLTLNGDGTYTYALTNSAVQSLGDGESETDTFTYTIVDADGDHSTTTLVITITGSNDAPIVTGSVAAVSEEGLPGGNPDTDGVPTDTTNSFEDSGQITIVDVDDSSFTVTLGLPSTPGLTSGGLPITWQLSPDGQVLTGATTAGSVIFVGIDDTGAWTVDLVGQIDHPDATVEDIFTFDIPVSVNDGTATTTITDGITVTVEDDSPILGDFSPATTSVPNFDGETASGTFDYSAGGDGHGDFTITYTGTPLAGVTYTTVQIDSDNDGINDGAILTASAGSTTLYTLEVDTAGNYTYTLVTADAAVEVDLSFSNLTAGGPGFRELEDDPDTAVNELGRVEFSTDSITDPQVNANNNNFGVGDTHLDIGEHFIMEFHNPGALGNDPALTDPQFLSALSINVNTLKNSPGNIGPNVTLQWTAYNTETGQTESGTVLVTATGDVLIDPTITFNQMRIENVNTSSPTDGGRIQIGGITVFETVLPQDQALDFEISATDSDGDPSSVSSLSVLVDTTLPQSMEMLDLSKHVMASAEETMLAANDMLANDNDARFASFGLRTDARSLEMATLTAAVSGLAMHQGLDFGSDSFGIDTGSNGLAMVGLDVGTPMAMVSATGLDAGFDLGAMLGSAGFDQGIDAVRDFGAFDLDGTNPVFAQGFDQPMAVSAPLADIGEPSMADQYASAMPMSDPMSAMDALLVMAAQGQSVAPQMAGIDGADALAGIAAQEALDQTIDYFAAAVNADGAVPQLAQTGGDGIITNLLNADVGGAHMMSVGLNMNADMEQIADAITHA
ncbi:DUF5801 repeats-in-toxin domain-containing protein [Qipengyuania zhejiangensis]|uniref:T1SS-143 repeat domain-containing protein n=1 Tax=Qipengyuania zhejiangensis TaxID=3077782 RepID=UPI002D798466|nr:DUF5801 repeats-in-toxin domain-containing protein [Qipengyuania sp. Z2]